MNDEYGKKVQMRVTVFLMIFFLHRDTVPARFCEVVSDLIIQIALTCLKGSPMILAMTSA